MRLDVLNRPNMPPQVRGRPMRLARAAATGLLAALALLALSHVVPARAAASPAAPVAPAHRVAGTAASHGRHGPWHGQSSAIASRVTAPPGSPWVLAAG